LAYDVEMLHFDCKFDDIESNPRKCLDIFYYDALNEFVNSDFYSKEGSEDEYHFPVLFGDDSAYTDSHYTFKFIDKLKQ
jgi:hypothetical protein